jgi:3-oxoacyl-[acyl-carrier-protein] synthase II
MIIAAGGGERDLKVDSGVMTAQAQGNSAPGFLNEQLMSDLRPTLFLAQLSNLLAGNIAIVHGVCGTSRTFMGEEVAGVDATRIALARIAAGQSDIALIGGSHNGERKDLLLLYGFGDYNLRHKFAPVWERRQQTGFTLGSSGAFLVIESKAHALARGAKPFARLTRVVSDRSPRRNAGEITASLRKLWSELGELKGGAILSGATGAEPATSEERAFLGEHQDFAVRSTSTRFGHNLDAQFALGLGVAALSVSRGALFPPGDSSGVEIEMSKPPTQIVVTATGHWRGEGMALVEAVS